MTELLPEPTPFLSPSRPKHGSGLGCWSNSHIPLPSVDLRPHLSPEGAPVWWVAIMLGSLRGSHWVQAELSQPQMVDFLRAWEAGPERALAELWPEEAQAYLARVGAPAEELWPEPQAPSTATAEDLGL